MGALKEQIAADGYAVVEDILDPATLENIFADYGRLLERLAPELRASGRIASTFAGLPVAERLAAVLSSSGENIFQHFDIALPNGRVEADTPIHLSRAVFDILRHERVLDVVEEVIGSEILVNPIQHARIKPPQAKAEAQPNILLKETPWHQDQAVTSPDADDNDMLTVWLAITDATLRNGCLLIVPGSHINGMALHCPLEQLTIPRQLLDREPIPLPVKAGDAILLNRYTKHASLPNRSDSIRWSFDLRYQPIGEPTGRDEFPSLVVRSRRDPASVQDYATWRDSWLAARARLANFPEREFTHRWDGEADLCA